MLGLKRNDRVFVIPKERRVFTEQRSSVVA